jgi:hypothetical protein
MYIYWVPNVIAGVPKSAVIISLTPANEKIYTLLSEFYISEFQIQSFVKEFLLSLDMPMEDIISAQADINHGLFAFARDEIDEIDTYDTVKYDIDAAVDEAFSKI